MEPDSPWWAEGIDLNKASAARVYDVHLGGSHNFQIDREVAEEAAGSMPSLPAVLRANRAFLRRAVQYLAHEGITQFLDLGSGIPTAGNVHEIAQGINPECRIVYVDVDLIAVAHSTALLRDNDRAVAIRADFRNTAEILKHPEVTGLLDFSKPVAVLLLSVLHFVPDEDDPPAIAARFVDPLVPGSYLAISHGTNDNLDQTAIQGAQRYSQRVGGFWLRTREQIAAMFGSLPLVEPGLVDFTAWRPDAPDEVAAVGEMPGYAGIARKP